MRLCIVGGALKGTEVAYLARKAGIETVVIDRWPWAPALSLANEAHILDVNQDPARALRLFDGCDAVIPTNEDLETMRSLKSLFRRTNVPLIHDFDVHDVCCSKARSYHFLHGLDIPVPRPWPECGFPIMVKPSRNGGSNGVSRVDRPSLMVTAVAKAREYDDEYVIQESVEGPTVSIEVISDGVEPVPLVTTEVILDETYDRKMVRSPYQDFDFDPHGFEEIGRNIAKGLGMKGILDIEAIVSNGIPKVLEINASMPSQTPSAVYQSNGVNMVAMLIEMFVKGRSPSFVPTKHCVASYEHLIYERGVLCSMGESALLGHDRVGSLRIEEDWFGFDDAITDFKPDAERWVASVMCTGRDKQEVNRKRRRNIGRLMEHCGITVQYDSKPVKVAY